MSTARRITSRDNPFLRELVELAHSARERRRQRRSVLEGVHLCQAYIERIGLPAVAVVSESGLTHPEVGALVAHYGLQPTLLTDDLFRQLSVVQNGIGIAFAVETPAPALPIRLESDAVYLDRLQDPGNVGTILRSCAAAGVASVFTAPGTAFCWSPKVLRAAMGAHFFLSIYESVPWAVLEPRLAVEATGTRVRQSDSLWKADLRAPRIWLLGNEGEGLSDEASEAVGRWLRIPQQPGVESLNVAAAAAVCLFEQARQRAMGGR